MSGVPQIQQGIHPPSAESKRNACLLYTSSDKNVKTANRTGKTDVRIAPEILNRMMSNPEVATKYENMLSRCV